MSTRNVSHDELQERAWMKVLPLKVFPLLCLDFVVTVVLWYVLIRKIEFSTKYKNLTWVVSTFSVNSVFSELFLGVRALFEFLGFMG